MDMLFIGCVLVGALLSAAFQRWVLTKRDDPIYIPSVRTTPVLSGGDLYLALTRAKAVPRRKSRRVPKAKARNK